MNRRRMFQSIGAGAAVLGLALCAPAAMQAQASTPPPDSSTTSQQSNPQAAMPMRRHRGPNPKRELKHLTKMLNLTPDQQRQMLPILQGQHKQMKAMHDDTSLSPRQRRRQMMSLMRDTHQKLKAVMTDSQKQQFDQMMRQRRQEMRDRRMGLDPGGNPPPPADNGTPPPPPQQ